MKILSAIAFILTAAIPFQSLLAQEHAGHEGHEAKAETKKQLWTCGMHPQVVLDHPGNCPICHMKLTPMKQNDEPSGSGSVKVSPEAIQSMGLASVQAVKGPIGQQIRTVGMVSFDETSLADVTTKFRGWVEKLDVDFTGREVHKGETLLELYSPEVFSAQAEFLIALKSKDERLMENSRLKLLLLDVPESITSTLERTVNPVKDIPVSTPRDGVVVEKSVVLGQMVEPGAKLYRIADLGTVWVIAQVYEHDLQFVKLGQKADVEVSYLQGRRYHGSVTYIYPTVDEATRTAKVRIELHNPGYTLKPGMFVNITLQDSIQKEGVLVPDGAVLRGGDVDIVFIDLGGGRYEPREVKIGPRVDKDKYQVVDGLKEGELVVSSGQFLLDSEANLRAAVRRLKPPQAEMTASVSNPTKAAQPQEPEYVCPMPEHMSITYKEPGKCPLCGMALVPYDPEFDNHKQLDHYTCAMHPEVNESKPGKCPKCAMTLIPVYKDADGKLSMDERTTVMEKPKADENAKIDHYECPMKEYSSPNPGKCPKCGMDLVPVYKK